MYTKEDEFRWTDLSCESHPTERGSWYQCVKRAHSYRPLITLEAGTEQGKHMHTDHSSPMNLTQSESLNLSIQINKPSAWENLREVKGKSKGLRICPPQEDYTSHIVYLFCIHCPYKYNSVFYITSFIFGSENKFLNVCVLFPSTL